MRPIGSTNRSPHQIKCETLVQRKECHTCRVNRPYSEFPRCKRRKDGRGSKCNGCQRDYLLTHKYGIDPDRYHDATHCHSCEVSFADIPGAHKHTDHCHETGRVRGILCNSCNWAEGHRTPTQLRQLADYIERTENTDLRIIS